jgi:hypothetical protein
MINLHQSSVVYYAFLLDSQRVNLRSYPPPTRSLASQLLPVAHESSHGPAGGEPGPANDAGHA